MSTEHRPSNLDLSGLETICAADKLNEVADKFASQRAEIERLTAERDDAARACNVGVLAYKKLAAERDRLRAALERIAHSDNESFLSSREYRWIELRGIAAEALKGIAKGDSGRT